MKKHNPRSMVPWLVAAGLFAIGATTESAAAPQGAQPAQSPAPAATNKDPAAPAPDPAATKALFEASCSNCHELSVVTDQRKTRDEWNETMNVMLSHGAALTDEQATQIVDYLVKNYAPHS